MEQVQKKMRLITAQMAKNINAKPCFNDTPLRKIAFNQRKQAWPRPHTISAARYNGLRVRPNGSVEALGKYYAWSCNLPVSFRVASVVKTNTHAMALSKSGLVYCWGHGMFGNQFQSFDILVQPMPIQNLPRARFIAANDSFSAIVTCCGRLYTWGMGQYGQGGHGDQNTYTSPKLVDSLENVQHVCVADYHCAAVVGSEGYVYAWGSNHFLKCAPNAVILQTTPLKLENMSGFASVTAAHYYTAAVSQDGTVKMWGGNMRSRCIIIVQNEEVLQAEATTKTMLLRTDKGNVFYVLWDMTVLGIRNIHVQPARFNDRVIAMGVANDNEIVVELTNQNIIGIGEHAQNWLRLYNGPLAHA